MPWYGWVLLGLGAFIALTAIMLRVLRMSDRGRRFLRLPVRGKVGFGRRLLSDPEVPIVAKVMLLVLVGYLAMPLDLIPDFVPVLGRLDDAAIAFASVLLLILVVPRERFEAALTFIEEEQERRRAERAELRGAAGDRAGSP